MLFNKASGILLHPTSLPGPYGIGEIGAEALHWLDHLRQMDQSLWQILPLGPTGYGDSPYQNLSTFAANTLLISLDRLWEYGLLDRSDLANFPHFDDDQVSFGAVIEYRKPLLQKAARAFSTQASSELRLAFDEFCNKHAAWLEDFAIFSALKEAHGGQPWTEWETPLRDRFPNAIYNARLAHHQAIEETKVLQFLFDYQWSQLRRAAAELKIKIIGDIPIFVAHDSVDVWAHRDLFYLDDKGLPTFVAGVPPDYFSVTGQRWGNPLYRWDTHKNHDYQWWASRIRRVLEWVDIVRIDHFRGFESYWEIPASEPIAVKGRWIKGPREDFFNAIQRQLGLLPIIAEDLGVITPEVESLRDHFKFPGIRILQFAFGDDPQKSSFCPENFIENCVAYTGTHDNDTIVGWFDSEVGTDSTRTAEQIEAERKRVLEYLETDGSIIHWDFINILLNSKADAVIFPLQDVLGLGTEARMNLPGTTEGNWRWRFTREQLTPEIIDYLADLTRPTGRNLAQELKSNNEPKNPSS